MTIDRRTLHIVAMLATLVACGKSSTQSPHPAVAAPAKARAAATISVAPWTLPVNTAQQPDLALGANGSVLMSWIEQQGDAQHLRFARWDGHAWSAPQRIADGEGIGNAADTPHIRQTPDGALWATWLRRTGGGEARDVVLARSIDDGRTWSTPVAVNTDGTSTEHGFAALWPEGRDALGVAWLDGRAKAGHAMTGMTHAMSHGEGATMLRAATFDSRLGRRDEVEVDASTCDCCQTDVATSPSGPTLVYRARRNGEVRDIAVVHRDATTWSAPRTVHDDHWSVDACPINGPALAASGTAMTVAWYTMATSIPTVRVATSSDAGANFGPSSDLAAGAGVLGRLDAAADVGGTWISWLEEQGDGQRLRVARLPIGGTTPSAVREVAAVGGRGRGTGWPRMLASNGQVFVVWTDVQNGKPHLRGAVLGDG